MRLEYLLFRASQIFLVIVSFSFNFLVLATVLYKIAEVNPLWKWAIELERSVAQPG